MSFLAERTDFPDRLLTASAGELLELLGRPTLFHLPGRRPEPVFVSVLLHGNEDVGWVAAQRILKKYQDQELPRAISLFVGNVSAAAVNERRLDGQPDYNRVWPGSESDGTPEHAMMRQITERMAAREPFASVDLHNNTGKNPHYACVGRTDTAALHLATLFGRTVVVFERPHGVQTRAFAPFCPAVTLECGKVGDLAGMDHAAEFLDAVLRLAEFPTHPVPAGDIQLYHTAATVFIPAGTTFGFENEPDVELHLEPELEDWNFRPCPTGEIVGRRRAGSNAALVVRDAANRDVTQKYLHFDNDLIRLAQPVMPSMLTLNQRVIELDCLGYFMDPYPYHPEMIPG